MKYAWFMFVYVCTVEPHIRNRPRHVDNVRKYECREVHALIKHSSKVKAWGFRKFRELGAVARKQRGSKTRILV